jgi:hypothetical protein
MMKSNKDKAKSLQTYYAGTTDARAEKISEILDELEILKLKFPNRTKLSEYVAKRLGKEEGSPVSSSTIRRNSKYNDILIGYLLRICPETIVNKVDNAIDSSLMQRHLRKQLEEKDQKIAELTREVGKAEALLEKRLELEYAEKSAAQIPLVEQIKRSEETDASLFEVLYKSLVRLEVVDIRVKEGVVYDWEEDKPIMIKTKFPKFFKWLATKV